MSQESTTNFTGDLIYSNVHKSVADRWEKKAKVLHRRHMRVLKLLTTDRKNIL